MYARTFYSFRLWNWSFHLHILYSACLQICVLTLLLYSRENRADGLLCLATPNLKTIMYHMDDMLWIYFIFLKTLYSELNHIKPSENHLQIEFITYGYCKNDKVYLLLWNAEHSQNFNIVSFLFYGFKLSYRKYLRWRYLRDVYAREDGSIRL